MRFPPDQDQLAKILRGLIAADILFVALEIPMGFLSAFVTETRLRESGVSIEPSHTDLIAFIALSVILSVTLPALIVSWIGLFNFWNWARWLYAGTYVVGTLMMLPLSAFDFSMRWGLEDSLSSLGTPIPGGIVAIIWLTPLANRFQQVKPGSSMPPPPPDVASATGAERQATFTAASPPPIPQNPLGSPG